jgi:hypothetical protein
MEEEPVGLVIEDEQMPVALGAAAAGTFSEEDALRANPPGPPPLRNPNSDES